jgi:2-methylcitrate dehydratase PrpD
MIGAKIMEKRAPLSPDVPSRRGITRELASFAVKSRFDALPAHVRLETARAFLNWMGCVFGGCREPAVEIAVASVTEAGGHPQASIIGHARRTDVASAAFVNCLSSSILAFDDTHLATVTHPTGPVAAALLAFCEKQPVSGEDFLNALALGIEIQCRLSNVLLLPPAQPNVAIYITGVTGPIGGAVALGRLLGLDEQKMTWAIGLAATQAAGFRATHGSMAGLVVPALAARSGVHAVMLAAKGFTCSDHVLEGDKGFVEIFSSGADINQATEGLGDRFELLSNAYKPYPCGIVVHPVIDACLEIVEQMTNAASPAMVTLKVHPLALSLTGRREPKTVLEAQISLFHWAAAVLLRRAAGLAQLRQDCIDDPVIKDLRGRINAIGDAKLGRDEAIAEVTLADGSSLRSHVKHARGSIARPMTDAELDEKFRGQAGVVLSGEASERLLRLCRNVAGLKDVGKEIAAVWAA